MERKRNIMWKKKIFQNLGCDLWLYSYKEVHLMKVAICSFQEIFYRSGEAQVSSRVHFKAFVLINT